MLQHLTTEQIDRLNTRCTLVNGVQTIVSIHQFNRVIIGVARATQYLNSKVIGFRAVLGRPRFHNRRQKIEQLKSLLTTLWVRMGFPIINQLRREQTQTPGALGVGFLGQQHTAHVGVLNQHDRWRQRVFTVGLTTLGTLFGVIETVLITAKGQGSTTCANHHPRFIHHVEHVFETLMGLAH